MGDIGDVLPSQSLGSGLKKITRQKQNASVTKYSKTQNKHYKNN